MLCTIAGIFFIFAFSAFFLITVFQFAVMAVLERK